MKRSPVPIPNKAELFCSGCQRFRPRAAIVAVKWIRNGKQAQYYCRPCQDRADAGRAESLRGG